MENHEWNAAVGAHVGPAEHLKKVSAFVSGSPNLSLAGVGGGVLVPPVDNPLIKGAHPDLVAVGL